MSEKPDGGESLLRNVEALSVSKRLVRSVSQKLKRKNRKGEEEEQDNARGVSLSCLDLYGRGRGRGGGCKVSADMDEDLEDPQSRRQSSASASDERKGYGNSESTMNCISNTMREKFWRRSNRKALQLEEVVIRNKGMDVFIPDDILEMCLMRLPLLSLMNARLVCKKWRDLTGTPRFWQTRQEGSFQSPWLFLFGVVKNGYCSEQILALDVSSNQWHKLDAEILRGRFLFSVVGARDDVYIVGGCTSLSNFGKVDKSSYKTHKSVVVFSPLTKSWHKASSMKYARSLPILGIYEASSDYLIIKNQQQKRRFYRSRIGSTSEVYEDPHRLSVRLQFRHSLGENDPSFKSYTFIRQKNGYFNKDNRRFVLIAIGGLGSWDEPLDSGEIYDSASNKWTEIPRLPFEFGIVCSGVVCNRMFYVYSETDKLAGFDIEGGYWIGIHTTPPPRVHEYNPRLIFCNSRLLMLSVSWCEGDDRIGRRNKAVRKVWELDLRYHTWIEISTHPDAPMDWNAAFVSDKTMIFGVEMFKIFGQVLNFLTVCDVSDSETNWSHISRNHVARQLDATSCMTKSVAVLHL